MDDSATLLAVVFLVVVLVDLACFVAFGLPVVLGGGLVLCGVSLPVLDAACAEIIAVVLVTLLCLVGTGITSM